MLTACEKAGEWEVALELLRTMRGDDDGAADGGDDDDDSAADVDADADDERARRGDRAAAPAAAPEATRPDVVSYNAVIAACARRGTSRAARWSAPAANARRFDAALRSDSASSADAADAADAASAILVGSSHDTEVESEENEI